MRFTKFIPANSWMMCCMAGEERSLNNAGMITPIGSTPRRAQNTFFHAPQVFIDQAREGRDDVLLKVGHASA